MHRFIKLIIILPCVLMMACNPQTPNKPVTNTTGPANNTTGRNAKNTATPIVEERKIEKPGELKIELPTDISLPKSTVVISAFDMIPNKKQFIYAQIPEITTPQGVADFYVKELPKHGWQILNGKGEERVAGGISLDFKKEKRSGTVSSYIKEGKTGTFMQIIIQSTQK